MFFLAGVYCSHAVRKTGRTEYSKSCLYCGEEFKAIDKNRKYCTSTCASRHAGEQRRGEYFCEYCGKPRSSDHPNRNRFCSRECANTAKHEETEKRNEEKRILHENEMKRDCDYCGETFVSKGSASRFCSDECRRLGILRELSFVPEERACPQCGKLFYTTLSAKDKIYCSEKCRARKDHKKYKDTRKRQMRKAFVEPVGIKFTYKKYGGRCAICGQDVPDTTEPSNQWASTVDHIMPISKGGLHMKSNCQLAHRLCNSIKLDVTEDFTFDWRTKMEEEPGRWEDKLDDLRDQIGYASQEAV